MLVSALFALLPLIASLASLTGAVPVNEPLNKLELRKQPVIRNGEHPHLAYVRHQNRAIKKMHRIKRTPAPDAPFFEERMLRARNAIEARSQAEKRYVIVDAATTGPVPTVTSSLSVTATSAAASVTTTVKATGKVTASELSTIDDDSENDTLLTSSSKLIAGGLGLDDDGGDGEYEAGIQVGTPARTFLMTMDTGSSDTWVPSQACTVADGCPASEQKLGSSSSSTFVNTGTPFAISYGSGNVSGTIVRDTITIAGMTLKDHTFGVVDMQGGSFSEEPDHSDGLMGLGMDALSVENVSTPIEALQQAGFVKQAVLGIALGRAADGTNDGEIVFGKADASKINAATTQTLKVLDDSGFYIVEFGSITVNGKKAVSKGPAVLDTGTTIIYGPLDETDRIHEMITGAIEYEEGTYLIPCETTDKVAIAFGNAAFQIDARDLAFGDFGTDTDNGAEYCISAISGVPGGFAGDDATWLLGDTFLKNVYFETNANTRTVQLSGRTDA